MRVSREGNLITLINVFETKPEQQQELIDQWIRLAEEVKETLGVPVATVTIVEPERQLFPGAVGLDEPWQTARETPGD